METPNTVLILNYYVDNSEDLFKRHVDGDDAQVVQRLLDHKIYPLISTIVPPYPNSVKQLFGIVGVRGKGYTDVKTIAEWDGQGSLSMIGYFNDNVSDIEKIRDALAAIVNGLTVPDEAVIEKILRCTVMHASSLDAVKKIVRIFPDGHVEKKKGDEAEIEKNLEQAWNEPVTHIKMYQRE